MLIINKNNKFLTIKTTTTTTKDFIKLSLTEISVFDFQGFNVCYLYY